MDKLKVVAVSYLNTKPLLYGLLRSPLASQLDLSLQIPSACAQRLRDGQADLGLVPVAIIPELPEWHLVSNFCIGANGPVKTVCLYGDRPLESWDSVLLDYHSRTSVALTQLLFSEYWQRDVDFILAQPGYETQIGGTRGGLIIGDRTIGMEQRYPYVYDLGAAWQQFTGLPFVFAAWISNRPLGAEVNTNFDAAFQQGVALIPELKYLLPTPHPDFDLEAYFTNNISYELDAPKRQSLELFLRLLETHPLVVPDQATWLQSA